MKGNNNIFAFSIIEVLIGIFIFSLWLISIFALLASSLNINSYNKNAIIASNLAREQIELFRNIRDTNYMKLQVWTQKNPWVSYSSGWEFSTGSYYTLESDFDTSSSFSTKVTEITSFVEGESELNSSVMQSYRLCLDNNIYTYDCSSSTALETPFYRYLYIEQTDGESGDMFTITSKVIWYKRGYHEYDIKTIVADWRRI